MHEFDACDGDRRMSKSLEPEHRTQPKFDGSMILFNEIFQVFRRSNSGPRAASVLREKFSRSPMRSLICVECDFARQALAVERSTEKRFGSGDISLGAQQKVHCFPRFVDGGVEIDPAAL